MGHIVQFLMWTDAHYVGCHTVKSSQMNPYFSLLYLLACGDSGFVGGSFMFYLCASVHIYSDGGSHRQLCSKITARNMFHILYTQQQLICIPVASKPTDIQFSSNAPFSD